MGASWWPLPSQYPQPDSLMSRDKEDAARPEEAQLSPTAGKMNKPFLQLAQNPTAPTYKLGILARKMHHDADGKKSECLLLCGHVGLTSATEPECAHVCRSGLAQGHWLTCASVQRSHRPRTGARVPSLLVTMCWVPCKMPGARGAGTGQTWVLPALQGPRGKGKSNKRIDVWDQRWRLLSGVGRVRSNVGVWRRARFGFCLGG